MFSDIVFSFTRGVAEHYNPDEPEFTPELFGYNAFESTGREWNFFPVDEMIYQEYSDRQDTTLDYLAASGFRVRLNDACLPNENQGMQESQPLVEADTAMAWKRLRPSALATVCKSLYIGASISILAATTTGVLYSLLTYVSYQTLFNCEYRPGESIPVKIQWIRTISTLIADYFPLHVVPDEYAVSLSPIPVKWGEKKMCFGCIFSVLFRCTLSSGLSNLPDISLQALQITDTSTQRYFLNQCNLATLFDCKSLSSALKRTAGVFIFENDNAELFHFCPWYSHNDFYLSLV